MKDFRGFNNKQHLIRDKLEPPIQARIRAKQMIEDEDEVKVFVDASELDFKGVFGLGICFVGQGNVIVKSKKHYNQKMKTHNVYGELQSIAFAIRELDDLIIKKKNHSFKLEIFSDCTIVDQLRGSNKLTRNTAINEVANGVVSLWDDFINKNEMINLQVTTMKADLKRYNPFYKAAHNAARRILNKN